MSNKIAKIKKETWERAKGFQPEDINDIDFIERASNALKISVENLALIWTTKSYEEYCEKRTNILNIARNERQAQQAKEKEKQLTKLENILDKIYENLEKQNELLERMIEQWKG